MLIRCEKCGKPIFFTPGFRRVECGYCYALNKDLPEFPAPLIPSEVDWPQPLLRYAASDGAAQPDPVWDGFLKDVPGYRELLEEKRKKAEAEARLKMESISARMESASQPEDIDSLLSEMTPIGHMPGARELLAALQEKKALLLRQKEIEEEKKRRRKKRLRRLGIIFALAAVLGVILWSVISVYVIRPRELESARRLAAEGDYAAAETVFSSLAEGGLFVNASVKREAAEDLKSLYLAWADSLAAEGRWAEAAKRYISSGRADLADQATRSHAAELEAENRLEEAAGLWETLGGDEGKQKAAELYAALFRQRLDAGDFGGALEFLDKAGFDEETLAEEKGRLYLRWGNALAEKGDPEGAMEKWLQAGDRPDIQAMIQEQSKRLIRENAEPVLIRWQTETDENAREECEETLRQQGEKLTRADEILYFFGLLDDAGIRISQVLPRGATVTDVSACGIDTETPGTADPSKPLVFFRQEKGYSLSQFDLLVDKPVHDAADSNNYVLRLIPSLWQDLPKNRRPKSMAECTCILLADCIYVPDTPVNGRFLIKQYDPLGIGGGVLPTVQPSPFSYRGKLPRYTARVRLLMWRWPAMEATVLNQQDTAAPRVQLLPTDEVVVDWSTTRNGVSLRELGLAGEFDTDWLSDRLLAAYLELLYWEDE